MSGSKKIESQPLKQEHDVEEREGCSPQPTSPPESESEIKLNAHFSSFISLRSAIDKYQKERHVQLIVKDSKLLSSESTKRIIPKVYHLVNLKLMYHSITYCCKCHGELRQKPGSRMKNIGAKRLSCPMYMRFKLSTDLQTLVLFDILEVHNHSTDPNTFQLSPRQQVYRLSAINSGKPDPGDHKREQKERESTKIQQSMDDVQTLIATAIKDVNSISSLGETDSEPPAKAARLLGHTGDEPSVSDQAKSGGVLEESSDEEEEQEEDEAGAQLDSDSSCSDSDEELLQIHRRFLPLPTRLIGSAVQSSPELLNLTKELIATQLKAANLKKQNMILETKNLELKNAKLALELKALEKAHAATVSDQSTTFYLQS